MPDSATTGHGRRCREQLHHGGDVGAAEHGEHTLLVAALRLKEPIHGPVLGLGVPDLQPREQLPDVRLRRRRRAGGVGQHASTDEQRAVLEVEVQLPEERVDGALRPQLPARRWAPAAPREVGRLGERGGHRLQKLAAQRCSAQRCEGTRATLPLQPHAQIRPTRGSARALPLPPSCCYLASRRPPAADLPPAAARERVRERGLDKEWRRIREREVRLFR